MCGGGGVRHEGDAVHSSRHDPSALRATCAPPCPTPHPRHHAQRRTQAAGKPVSTIFAEDGEADFREVETQVLAVRRRRERGCGWGQPQGAGWLAMAPCPPLPTPHPSPPVDPRPPTYHHIRAHPRAPPPPPCLQELAPFKDCVIATGGGVPTRAVNWGHMQGGVSVWLNGPPSLLAHRVVGDGTETRPLLAQARGGVWVGLGVGWGEGALVERVRRSVCVSQPASHPPTTRSPSRGAAMTTRKTSETRTAWQWIGLPTCSRRGGTATRLQTLWCR